MNRSNQPGRSHQPGNTKMTSKAQQLSDYRRRLKDAMKSASENIVNLMNAIKINQNDETYKTPGVVKPAQYNTLRYEVITRCMLIVKALEELQTLNTDVKSYMILRDFKSVNDAIIADENNWHDEMIRSKDENNDVRMVAFAVGDIIDDEITEEFYVDAVEDMTDQNSWETADPNSIIPENSAPEIAALDPTRTGGFDAQQKLTPEQMDWLLKRLSSEDQDELGKILKNCTFEMTMTRGLPFAALVTGSMYFARSRLPEDLRFGPKRWPFYALVGFGAMTAANMLSMNKCGERVKPKIWELYHKYNANTPVAANVTSYEALRAKNRHNLGHEMSNQSYPVSNMPTEPVQEEQQFTNVRQPRPDSGFIYEDPPVMSGTPYDRYPPPKGQQDSSSGNYGDRGLMYINYAQADFFL
uniref:Mediator of RNA polymerase II transcription subunit 22 n=1 Tax=Panagrolaimus sp. JU765 TaxID=591449 RepID=A0AC34QVU5_9BILA